MSLYTEQQIKFLQCDQTEQESYMALRTKVDAKPVIKDGKIDNAELAMNLTALAMHLAHAKTKSYEAYLAIDAPTRKKLSKTGGVPFAAMYELLGV